MCIRDRDRADRFLPPASGSLQMSQNSRLRRRAPTTPHGQAVQEAPEGPLLGRPRHAHRTVSYTHLDVYKRQVYYDSVETKMRDFRIRRALYEIGRLRSLGESYTSLASNLWFRKVTKMRQRKLTTTKSRDRGKPGKQGLDLA